MNQLRVRSGLPFLASCALLASCAVVPCAALLAVWLLGDSIAVELRRIFALLTPLHVLEAVTAFVAVGARAFILPGEARARVAAWGSRSYMPVARLLNLPARIGLPVIVAVAAAFRIVLGRAQTIPAFLGDQIVYTGLAKGIALHGEPLLRGRLQTGYSLLYPLFLSPAYWLAATGAEAFEAAKIMNALAISLTAVPTYFLARRVVSHRWSLLVAALTVAGPWTVYSALTTTESLFYPTFVTFAMALAWMLERPTTRRQVVLLLLLAVLVGIRPQALALAGSLVAAIVLDGHLRRSLPQALWRYGTTWVAFALIVTVAFAAAMLGLPVSTSGYSSLLGSLGHPLSMGKWAIWNLADFELSLGVIALTAFPLGLRQLLRRDASESDNAVGVVALTLAAGIFSSAVLLSATPYGLGILHERYLFYLTPLVLIGLARWLTDDLPRQRLMALPLAATAVLIVAALPTEIALRSNNVEAPTMSFLRGLKDEVPGVTPRVWAIGLTLVASAAFLLVRSKIVPLLSVGLAFVALTAVNDYTGPLTIAQDRALAWVDRGLPSGETATIVHLGFPRYGSCGEDAEYEQQGLIVWTEFFNTRADRVFHIAKDVRRDGLTSPELTIAPGGLIVDGKRPFRPGYVVIDTRQPIVGKRLVRFDLSSLHSQFQMGASLTLWKVDPPLRFLTHAQPLPARADGSNC